MNRVQSYGEENDVNLKLIVSLIKNMQNLGLIISEQMRGFGITSAQFAVMEVLYHKGSLTVNQIIEKTFSTSGNSSLVIKNLCKEGLTVKKENPEDKRSKLISLTRKGDELMSQIFPEHILLLAEALSHLTCDEKKEVTKGLRKLGKRE